MSRLPGLAVMIRVQNVARSRCAWDIGRAGEAGVVVQALEASNKEPLPFRKSRLRIRSSMCPKNEILKQVRCLKSPGQPEHCLEVWVFRIPDMQAHRVGGHWSANPPTRYASLPFTDSTLS